MRILVVDDEKTNIIVLKKLLEKESHEVFIANNGKEAVEQFELVQPELVLMDVMMPVMDGYEATRLIKESAGEHFLPIIFITAMTGDEALANCLNKGGDDYISKPLNKNVLHAKIDAMQRMMDLYATVNEQNKELRQIHDQFNEEHILAEQVYNDVVKNSIVHSPLIHIHHQPADKFNGDIIMAVRTPRDGINFLVGDVTGHGLAAALCALPIIDIFYRMTLFGYEIETIIAKINNKACELLPKGRFVAACFMNIETKEKKLKIWNGGMPDVLLYNPQSGIKKRVQSMTIPLGIVDNSSLDLSMEKIFLEEGDRFLAYSDGLIEAENCHAELYGQDRLESFLCNNPNAENLVELLRSDLAQHVEQEEIRDDVTMLEVLCELPQLTSIVKKQAISPLAGNWQIDLTFDAITIKSMDPVPVVLSIMSELCSFSLYLESMYIVISEMFSNALEHGLLNLDSDIKETEKGFEEYYLKRKYFLDKIEDGYIRIKISREVSESGGCLVISVEDSGDGFDKAEVLARISADERYSHRGLMLLHALCKEVKISEKGNEITVVFAWEN